MNSTVSNQLLRSDLEGFRGDEGALINEQNAAKSVKYSRHASMRELRGTTGDSVACSILRDKLFGELVLIYAEATEYPHEVFTESVELTTELEIDFIEQAEIMRSISLRYCLPPLPDDFRAGDLKTMGKVVDFVFANRRDVISAFV